jgi:Cutinase
VLSGFPALLSRRFHTPQRGRLWITLALAAVLVPAGGAVGLVTSASSTIASAASAPGPVLGPACPDVMVIAARGVGEQPQPQTNPPTSPWYGTWSDPAAYTVLNPYPNVKQGSDTYYGVGRFNYDVYTTLKDANNQLQVSLDPVRYPSNPAPKTLADLPTFVQNLDPNVAAGAYSMVTEFNRTRAACGDQVHFVLAGYSQGAWVVHRALYALAAQNDGSLDLLSAVVLFGDPEFQPGQMIDQGSQKGLTNSGLATPVDVANRNVPASVQDKTASYCLFHDPICQGISPVTGGWGFLPGGARCFAVNWAYGKCPHTNYETSGATAQAASFVQPLLPKPSGGGGSGGGGGSTSWTAAEAPLPGNAAHTPGLMHVACPSSTCAAVGSYADSAGNSHIVVDWGSGSNWTPVDAPLPGDAIISADDGPGITSEACAAGSSCVLAGVYANSAGSQGLLIAGSGTSWTATQAPVPGNAATNPGVSINSVACPSAAFCAAVGTYTDSSGQQQGLLLTGSGSSWKATQAPLPSNAAATPGPYLSSVACESAASCVAVGNYLDSSSRGQGLLITWSGTSWAPIESPAPGGAPGGAGLQSVACSASVCAAAGLYSDGSSAFGLLVSGSGSTWTAAEAPLPADAAADPSPNITSMTCPAASTCVAVGSYDASSGSTFTWQGLLLTGLGSSWTAAKSPLPAGAADSPDLTSVACGSASACVVTGSYDDSSSTAHGVLLTGSGSSWTIVSPPVPANALPANQTEFFNASACPSASTCVIAGEYTDSSVASQGLLLSGPS